MRSWTGSRTTQTTSRPSSWSARLTPLRFAGSTARSCTRSSASPSTSTCSATSFPRLRRPSPTRRKRRVATSSRSRATTRAEPPPGLTYQPDFLTADDQGELLAEIEAYPFHEVRMRGQVARRTVIHFGWDYDYEGWKVHPTTPPSPRLATLRDRCATMAGVPPESLEQFLVARYPLGATIGWHRDAPMFGSPVAGVSL